MCLKATLGNLAEIGWNIDGERQAITSMACNPAPKEASTVLN